jgi:hypothetical protein
MMVGRQHVELYMVEEGPLLVRQASPRQSPPAATVDEAAARGKKMMPSAGAALPAPSRGSTI